jgi:hypothetical protein
MKIFKYNFKYDRQIINKDNESYPFFLKFSRNVLYYVCKKHFRNLTMNEIGNTNVIRIRYQNEYENIKSEDYSTIIRK